MRHLPQALRRYPLVAPLTCLGVIAFVLVALPYAYLSYDEVIALARGRVLLHGSIPGLGSPSTSHPLTLAAATVLALLRPSPAYLTYTAVYIAAFLLLLYAVYRLAKTLGGTACGLLAVALIFTRWRLVADGAQAIKDVPYAAFLLLGLALILEDRRRNRLSALGFLAVAGLIRPEAWLFSLAYAVWLLHDRGWSNALGERGWSIATLALAIAAPTIWLLQNTTLIGDTLYNARGNGLSVHAVQSPAVVAKGGFESQLRDSVSKGLFDALGIPIILIGGFTATWVIATVRRAPEQVRRRAHGLTILVIACLCLFGLYVAEALHGHSLVARYLLVPALGMLSCAAVAPVFARNSPLAIVALVAATLAILIGLPSDIARLQQRLGTFSDRQRDARSLISLAQRPQISAAISKCQTIVFVPKGSHYLSTEEDYPPIAHVALALGRDPNSIQVYPNRRLHPGMSAFETRGGWRLRGKSAFKTSKGPWIFESACSAKPRS
jgi:hypothetical protein